MVSQLVNHLASRFLGRPCSPLSHQQYNHLHNHLVGRHCGHLVDLHFPLLIDRLVSLRVYLLSILPHGNLCSLQANHRISLQISRPIGPLIAHLGNRWLHQVDVLQVSQRVGQQSNQEVIRLHHPLNNRHYTLPASHFVAPLVSR